MGSLLPGGRYEPDTDEEREWRVAPSAPPPPTRQHTKAIGDNLPAEEKKQQKIQKTATKQ